MILDNLDDGAKRLMLVLCLPLVDGVFATLLVSGAIDTFSDIVAIALTIFTGAGALAVLYSHAESREHAKKMVYQAVPFLLIGAVAVALVAPIFEQLLYVSRMRYAAGLALLVIAADLADLGLAEKLSVHGIILTGLVLSLKNPGALYFSAEYIIPAMVTTLVAAIGLYAAAYVNPERLDLNYIRKGGSLVLLMISLSLFGVNMPSGLNLAVFLTSIVASIGHSS